MAGKSDRSVIFTARSLQARAREDKALRLRNAGASMAEIATAVGYGNSGGASKAVARAQVRAASMAQGDPEDIPVPASQIHFQIMDRDTRCTMRGRAAINPESDRAITWDDGQLSGDADELVAAAQEGVIRTSWPATYSEESGLITASNPIHDRGTALPLLRSLFVEPPEDT